MLVARETWWHQVERLCRVAARPFALDDMKSVVPYTRFSEQGTPFYVQAAVIVSCAIHDEPGWLAPLVSDLAAGSRGGDLTDRLPRLRTAGIFAPRTSELSH